MTAPILVADAGGTSCRWVLISETGRTFITSEGFNASTTPDDIIMNSVRHMASELLSDAPAPQKVFFYGAGSHTPLGARRVTETLRSMFGEIEIHCESDLLGAARALHGDNPGAVFILGTGANAGVYDGKCLKRPVPPLGYILGDEGSGAYLGKIFLKRMLRGEFPAEVISDFNRRCNLDEAEVIERVYRTPGANTFLGSMCPVIKELSAHDSVSQMITDAFTDFRTALAQPAIDVMYGQTDPRMTNIENRPNLGFIGSVARHFAPWLLDTFFDCKVTIIADPLPRLADYHSTH